MNSQISPLILIALSFTTIAMLGYAAQSLSNGNTGSGITFILLSLLNAALVTYGIIRNKRMARH